MRRIPWRLLAVLAAVAALPAVGAVGLLEPLRALGEAVRGAGAWAVLPMALVGAVLAGAAVLPVNVIAVFAGWTLGFVLGLPTMVLAVVGASVLGHALARRLAGRGLEKLVAARPGWAAMLERGGRPTLVTIALRLPPQVPFALGTAALAGAGVPLRPFVVGTLVGMLPRVALACWLGSTLAGFDPSAAAERAGPLLLIAGAAVGLGVVGPLVFRRRAQDTAAEAAVPVTRGDSRG